MIPTDYISKINEVSSGIGSGQVKWGKPISSGPDHQKLWSVEGIWQGIVGRGEGTTMQGAKHACAQELYEAYAASERQRRTSSTGKHLHTACTSRVRSPISAISESNQVGASLRNEPELVSQIDTSTAVAESNVTSNTAMGLSTDVLHSLVERQLGFFSPPNITDIESMIRWVLRSNGRRWVTAAEVRRQILLSFPVTRLPSKRNLNNHLYQRLEKKNFVQRKEVVKGEEKMVFWQSRELEVTSIDEVEALVVDMNIQANVFEDFKKVVEGSEHPGEFTVESKEMHVQIVESVSPASVSASPQPHLGSSSDLSEPRTNLPSSVQPIHPEFRVQIGTLLRASSPEFLSLWGDHIAQAFSKPTLEQSNARIGACHRLLEEMSRARCLTQEYKQKALLAYHRAYERGKLLSVGDRYPFGESAFLEFKGKAKTESLLLNDARSFLWTTAAFENKLAQVDYKSICAFINTAILHSSQDLPRPLVPACLVLGVQDETSWIHGIWFDRKLPIQGTINEFLVQMKDRYGQQIRQRLTARIVDVPRRWRDRIINAIDIEFQHLNVPDSFLAAARAARTDPNAEFVVALFKLSLNFDHPAISSLKGCKVSVRGSKCPIAFKRGPKPETTEVTDAEELEDLFPDYSAMGKQLPTEDRKDEME